MVSYKNLIINPCKFKSFNSCVFASLLFAVFEPQAFLGLQIRCLKVPKNILIFGWIRVVCIIMHLHETTWSTKWTNWSNMTDELCVTASRISFKRIERSSSKSSKFSFGPNGLHLIRFQSYDLNQSVVYVFQLSGLKICFHANMDYNPHNTRQLLHFQCLQVMNYKYCIIAIFMYLHCKCYWFVLDVVRFADHYNSKTTNMNHLPGSRKIGPVWHHLFRQLPIFIWKFIVKIQVHNKCGFGAVVCLCPLRIPRERRTMAEMIQECLART